MHVCWPSSSGYFYQASMISSWRCRHEFAIPAYYGSLPSIKAASHSRSLAFGGKAYYSHRGQLLADETQAKAKAQRTHAKLVCFTGLPSIKTLEGYDFGFANGQPLLPMIRAHCCHA